MGRVLMWVPEEWVAAGLEGSLRRVIRLVREQAEAYLRGDPLRNVITSTY